MTLVLAPTLLVAAVTGTDLAQGVAVVLLLALVLAFVTVESALSHTSPVRIEALAEHQPKRVKRAAALLEHPEALLNPLRLVTVIAQVSETAILTLLATRWLDDVGVVIVVVVNIAVVFVVAEAVPRTLGILHAERVAIALARPVAAFATAGPIRLLAAGLIGLSNVIVPGKGLRRGPFASPEELIALADAAVEDEVLEPNERDLIESVIEFGDTVVREVMVHRTDMATIEQSATVADALELSSELGYSRMPVVGENVDDVVGLVYVKDLIRAELDGKTEVAVGALQRDARFVPETKKVAELLREMQLHSYHMAIAVDEYGGTAGLVTLEDLIEELVGEIVDEYDKEEPLIQRLRDGSLRVDARILIDELNHIAGLELPEGDWDTVGGLVFDAFGRVPTEGETRVCDGYPLRVERVQGRRILKVKILPRTVDPTDDEPESTERRR